eukprot:85126-Pleurochrysis_carterae.AAC.6
MNQGCKNSQTLVVAFGRGNLLIFHIFACMEAILKKPRRGRVETYTTVRRTGFILSASWRVAWASAGRVRANCVVDRSRHACAPDR